MAIKICCTKKDGEKNHNWEYSSMEYLVKNKKIKKLDNCYGLEIEPARYFIMYHCPYCGAKIEEDDKKEYLNTKADNLLLKCELIEKEISNLKREINES